MEDPRLQLLPTLLQLAERRRAEAEAEDQYWMAAPQRAATLRQTQLENAAREYAASPEIRALALGKERAELEAKKAATTKSNFDVAKAAQDQMDQEVYNFAAGKVAQNQPAFDQFTAPMYDPSGNIINRGDAELPAEGGGMVVPFDKAAVKSRADLMREYMDAKTQMLAKPAVGSKEMTPSGWREFAGLAGPMDFAKNYSPAMKDIAGQFGPIVQTWTPSQWREELDKATKAKATSQAAGKGSNIPFNYRVAIEAANEESMRTTGQPLDAGQILALKEEIDAKNAAKKQEMQIQTAVKKRELVQPLLMELSKYTQDVRGKWLLRRQENGPVDYYDADTGEWGKTTWGDYKAHQKEYKPLPTAIVAKANEVRAQEVAFTLNNVKESIMKMPDIIPVTQSLAITAALKNPNDQESMKSFEEMKNQAWYRHLTPEGQQLVDYIKSANESLIAFGASSGAKNNTDATRAALAGMLPTGQQVTRDDMLRKMDILDQEMGTLSQAFLNMPKSKSVKLTEIYPPKKPTDVIVPRNPGESIADYLKRTKKK